MKPLNVAQNVIQAVTAQPTIIKPTTAQSSARPGDIRPRILQTKTREIPKIQPTLIEPATA